MKISISSLNYTILNEEKTGGTPATESQPREVVIPDSVVEELGLTEVSYQEIGQYLVDTLGKELGHPISGIAWEVIKNVVPFNDPRSVIDVQAEVLPSSTNETEITEDSTSPSE
jgi:hypothetical protein